MPRHGRISQIQKMARATPKAKARQQGQQGRIKLGAAPHKPDHDDKEDWACRDCYERFAGEGRVAHYQFISGAKLLCRPLPGGCGQHKGKASLRLQVKLKPSTMSGCFGKLPT